jgi:hypothetical protein
MGGPVTRAADLNPARLNQINLFEINEAFAGQCVRAAGAAIDPLLCRTRHTPLRVHRRRARHCSALAARLEHDHCHGISQILCRHKACRDSGNERMAAIQADSARVMERVSGRNKELIVYCETLRGGASGRRWSGKSTACLCCAECN